MTHGSVAAKVRAAKDKWPLRYCSDARCLWNLSHGPCPKHRGTRTAVGTCGWCAGVVYEDQETVPGNRGEGEMHKVCPGGDSRVDR